MTDTKQDTGIAKEVAPVVIKAAEVAIEEQLDALKTEGEMRDLLKKQLELFVGFFVKQLFDHGVIPITTSGLAHMLAQGSVESVEKFKDMLVERVGEQNP